MFMPINCLWQRPTRKLKLLWSLHTFSFHYLCNYSLFSETVNVRENFWNVYCFATNQMRDETTKDNRQTAAGISHYLIMKQRAGFFFYKKSSIFPLDLSEKPIF